jgi:DNA-binding MarR family transcriptional regulator
MPDSLPATLGRRRGAPAALDMTPLAGHVGFLLRLAQQQVFDEFHRRFAAAGLTPARYSVLALLHANPDVQQGHLAEALRIKPSNMAVLLAGMEALSLVDRRVDAGNRRANRLRLTAAGAALYRRLTPDILAMEARVAQRLSEAEYACLLELLARMSPP